jgi:hypothetical protein
MVDLREEGYMRLLERIFRREVNGELEHSTCVGTVGRRHNDTLPLEEIVACGAGATAGGRILLDIRKLLLNSTKCHSNVIKPECWWFKPRARSIFTAMEPHMGAAEKRLFYKFLHSPETRFYYEFGSGGSTYKAIRAPNIERIVSMESDTAYYISTQGLLSAPKCERILIEVGARNNWGNPLPDLPLSQYELYFKHIDSIGAAPDLILIDGRWRVACALHAWAKCSARTVVLVDDFQRAEYADILKYFTVIDSVGSMVALKANPDIVIDTEDFRKYEYDGR